MFQSRITVSGFHVVAGILVLSWAIANKSSALLFPFKKLQNEEDNACLFCKIIKFFKKVLSKNL